MTLKLQRRGLCGWGSYHDLEDHLRGKWVYDHRAVQSELCDLSRARLLDEGMRLVGADSILVEVARIELRLFEETRSLRQLDRYIRLNPQGRFVGEAIARRDLLRPDQGLRSAQSAPLQQSPSLRVFVCYSHNDTEVAKELINFLRAATPRKPEIRFDGEIPAGAVWHEWILEQIEWAEVVIVLVSQDYLDSRYARESELPALDMNRRRRRLRIMPIIVSPCDWLSHQLLQPLQSLPRNGESIQLNYGSPNRRRELFAEISEELQR